MSAIKNGIYYFLIASFSFGASDRFLAVYLDPCAETLSLLFTSLLIFVFVLLLKP